MFKFKISYVALAAALSATGVNADPFSYNHLSGAKVIDIEAPNAAGVSHNMYREFNVSDKGAILNNSASDVVHGTLGNIARNNNLANGSASVILNEVTSNKSSALNGFIEVNGQRADVVIANPNGISCSGCSFVNANKVVMTTGKVNMTDAGAIGSYTVTGGKISIDGNGMNAAENYAALLADVISLNGQVNVKNAMISAGNFTLNNSTGQITSAGKTATLKQMLFPEYSIDVSAMGGVKADNITMVGNNLGFGVRNTGAIVAKGVLSMASNGMLVNERSITNNGMVTQIMSAGEIKNTGNISSANIAVLNSANNLVNTGTIFSGNQMAVSAASDFSNKGTIKAINELVIATNGNLENMGAAYIHSGNRLTISAAGNITQKGGSMYGANTAFTFGGNSFTSDRYIYGTETLQITSTKDNQLSSGEIINSGSMSGGDILIQTNGTITQHANSQIKASKSLTTASNWLNNSGYMGGTYTTVMIQNNKTDNYGHIEGTGVSVITSGDLYNEALIRSWGDLTLSTQNKGNIINRGHITAQNTLNLTAKKVENGGYKCGFLNLKTCGVGALTANKLILDSSHKYASNMGGNQNFKATEITAR